MIQIKRVYDPAVPEDGYRVLVDRLWPRGIRKVALAVDEWAKAIAPSNSLRTWYSHQPEHWPEFERRYRVELATEGAVSELNRLRSICANRPLTLLTATRQATDNHATVLKALLIE